ncbi:MAG: dipeptidase [Planctomycetota bacterium]
MRLRPSRSLTSALLCATALAGTAVLPAQTDPAPDGHRVFVLGKGRVVILARDGSVEWEMPLEGAVPDPHPLENGNLMLQRALGEIVEIERHRKAIVWSYERQGLRWPAFLPLPGGDVLVADREASGLVVVDRQGRTKRELAPRPEAPDESGHWRFEDRPVQATGTGTVLVTHLADCTIRSEAVLREYDLTTGEVVWEFAVPGFGTESSVPHDFNPFRLRAFAASRLPNGNTLLTMGRGSALIEVTPGKEIVWRLNQDEIEGISLSNTRTIEVLDNGHYVLGLAAGPLLVELDPESKDVVWQLERDNDIGPSQTFARCLDVGPDAELLARARRIHRSTLTLDTHKDISTTLASPDLPEDPAQAQEARLRNDPTVWGTNQVDFPKMRAGGLDVAFYIVYVGQGSLDDEGFARARSSALAKFEAIERMARRYPDDIEIARTPDDVERIAATGKLVCCIGIENGYAMGMDLGAIEEFHARGARYMSLTHTRHSQLGDSNTPADEPLHGGLSDLGRRAIEEMNRVGIMVDISHAGKETTLQAIAHSKAPVIASHSSVDAVYEHGRNLSDEELLALKENGGVLQAVAFASYVRDDGGRRAFIEATREELGLPRQRGSRRVDDDPEVRAKMKELRDRVRAFDETREIANVSDFVDHIDHAVEVMGIDHVAISSDFDGGGGIEGWRDASQTFNVTLELVRRGYTEEQIRKIWSGNTLRVWRAVEKVAERLSAESR